MDLLYIIVIVLVILWLGGFSTKIGGNFVHILLVIAAIILLFRLLT
ncbi:MAG: hypothetical protein UR34_C0003G0042 [candidate division WS6 bacterium GW2011_GWC1_33_20]|uniref:Lmo0937 family membrane protein n=2 Tax=Candidatus Dojkabacteria TaxID=74243 RepID=A0A0G0DJ78_9BACT|nr:MAG: hypothetical protein UR32_C0003G0003 [candidate division WS6 bacterium GW2011_GWE2_33_157]KKP44416.1 MAG: hypothetical protein UR34_C0003G0042 [candidate division WS6 bacterium GW2011_GWC1_33_20]KKP46046.1 MAG: hypothetical protein UR36_C0002G0088 [candidate division WS6 bacterium GW2011_GWF1_33_233]KKP55442.1 MAG: hypothetical protein UR47_C0001G0003 [candidate division WS6 bacterium GW2011_GWB1_33_6]KKP55521.1 MAG: hypothetical protein UR45_C0001G0003 [candidate division WS6 bacterium